MFLIPFVPMRMSNQFLESGGKKKDGYIAILLALLLYGVSVYISFSSESGMSVSLFFIFFNVIIPRLLGIVALLILSSFLGSILSAFEEGSNSYLPLAIGFSLLPIILVTPIYMIFPSAGFDIYYILLIWQTVVYVIGLNVFCSIEIKKAAIIGVVATVIVRLIAYYFHWIN
ncbi:MAG: hypothetical protein HUJ25_14660 [Crocinitomicaceae bacterium]|nr:hypothetical protein [Crocinitomicaceae bacterium]